MKVEVILACCNRAAKTEKCILSLEKGNPSLDFHFIVVNDGSTDETQNILEKLNAEYHNISTILEDGSLFYSKSMNRGMQWLNTSGIQSDYVMLINDDVDFYDGSIEKIVSESIEKKHAIIVGAMHDGNGNFTYGGVRYKPNSIDIEFITIKEPNTLCDTFNANCVLIPWKTYLSSFPMDSYYSHACGDFDYGLSLKRMGAEIYSSSFFVGVCKRNSIKGTWLDTSLSPLVRIKKKESRKGLPFRSYFHYLNKNFGIINAVLHSFAPYIKILLKR